MTLDYGYGPHGLGSYYLVNNRVVLFTPDHGVSGRKKKLPPPKAKE